MIRLLGPKSLLYKAFGLFDAKGTVLAIGYICSGGNLCPDIMLPDLEC